MRKVIQITTPEGVPLRGHIFEAPDLPSLEAAMDAELVPGCWHEVATDADLVVAEEPPPATPQ